MLSHFLNVSFTLPQALELDKGQDYWWLHVIFPYFILFIAWQGRGEQSPRPTGDRADPCVFILRFSREPVEAVVASSVNESGMKILN